MEKKVYTVKQVAKLLGIHEGAAYQLAKTDGFPSIRIGKRIIIPKAAFHRWLETAGNM